MLVIHQVYLPMQIFEPKLQLKQARLSAPEHNMTNDSLMFSTAHQTLHEWAEKNEINSWRHWFLSCTYLDVVWAMLFASLVLTWLKRKTSTHSYDVIIFPMILYKCTQTPTGAVKPDVVLYVLTLTVMLRHIVVHHRTLGASDIPNAKYTIGILSLL